MRGENTGDSVDQCSVSANCKQTNKQKKKKKKNKIEQKTHKTQTEDHRSCIAHLSAEDMLKSAITEEKKIKNTESE